MVLLFITGIKAMNSITFLKFLKVCFFPCHSRPTYSFACHKASYGSES